jgi:hypothetical protein
MANKWIQKAIKNKGALHRQLGVSQEKKIPTEKLEKVVNAIQKKSEKKKLTASELKLLRRANLAKTLRRLRK